MTEWHVGFEQQIVGTRGTFEFGACHRLVVLLLHLVQSIVDQIVAEAVIVTVDGTARTSPNAGDEKRFRRHYF